jgi:lipoprotein-releasing system permease protein
MDSFSSESARSSEAVSPNKRDEARASAPRFKLLPAFVSNIVANAPLALFFAARYLRSKHSLNFISVITGISIGGTALGVAALIIVMSLFNGFQSLIDRFLIGADPHVRVTFASHGSNARAGGSGFWTGADADSLLAEIERLARPLGAERLAYSASGKMICANGRLLQPFQLIGIDASVGATSSEIASTVVAGNFLPTKPTTQEERRSALVPLVMGYILADKLRLSVGDTVRLLSPSAIESSLRQGMPPRMNGAIIVGIFQANVKDYDAANAYATLEAVESLLNLPRGAPQRIDIRLADIDRSEELKRALVAKLGARAVVETWFDLHSQIYNIMRLERLAAFCVLFIIIIVAAFNIFASLSMTVAEKRAEIGMLKAMGAPRGLIVAIFFSHALLVGALGTVLGAALGTGFCAGQMTFGWIKFDSSRYVFSILPLLLDWRDVVIVSAAALSFSLLSGFAPASQAGAVRSTLALLRKERV